MTTSYRCICDHCLEVASDATLRHFEILTIGLGARRCEVCGVVADVNAIRGADAEVIHRAVAEHLNRQRAERGDAER